jgi:hypothetical protein
MREIIVLEVNVADGGNISINFVFWFPVLVNARVPIPNIVTAVNAVLAGGQAVTTTEFQDLQSGAVVEEYYTRSFPNNYTTAQIKSELQAAWTTRKSYRDTLPNKISNYGLSWDGTVWSS